jgi:hypothetical protein
VWSESAIQARDTLRYWSSKSSVKSTADDTHTLSLHVLSSAGFGNSYQFQGHDEISLANVAISYEKSLHTMLDNCILLMVLGTKFLSLEFLRAKLKRLYQAAVTFKQCMTKVYETEKQAISEGKITGKNLMTSLIRASQESVAFENGESG